MAGDGGPSSWWDVRGCSSLQLGFGSCEVKSLFEHVSVSHGVSACVACLAVTVACAGHTVEPSDVCHTVVISVLRLREKQFFVVTFYGLEATEPLSLGRGGYSL